MEYRLETSDVEEGNDVVSKVLTDAFTSTYPDNQGNLKMLAFRMLL